MATTYLARTGLPQQSADTDSPTRAEFNDAFSKLDDKVGLYGQGSSLGARPSAGNVGTYWEDDSTGIIWYDNGSIWKPVGANQNSIAISGNATGTTPFALTAAAGTTVALMSLLMSSSSVALTFDQNGKLSLTNASGKVNVSLANGDTAAEVHSNSATTTDRVLKLVADAGFAGSRIMDVLSTAGTSIFSVDGTGKVYCNAIDTNGKAATTGALTVNGTLTLNGDISQTGNQTTSGSVTAQSFAGFGIVPIGAAVPFFGSAVPSGWYLCNGQQILQTAEPQLYNAIGQNGAPTGYFAVPDLRDASPVGASGTKALLSKGGSQNHTHSTPNHTHPLSNNGYAHVNVVNGNVYIERESTANWTANQGAAGSTQTAGTEGFGAVLDGRTDSDGASTTGSTSSYSPYVATNWIIRAR